MTTDFDEDLLQRITAKNKVKHINICVSSKVYSRYWDVKHRLKQFNPDSNISEVIRQNLEQLLKELDNILTEKGY